LEADLHMAHLKDAPDSQFAYVVVVARRARQLLIGGRPMVDNPRSRKTTRIAEEELQKGLLEYDAPHLNEQAEDINEKKKK
jgi:DNA-directed RNA polymerase omega subunit